MKKISLFFILTMAVQYIGAQTYDAHTSWRNMRITQTDSTIVITTFGEQFYRNSLHDSIFVTTDLFPLHFIDDKITSLKEIQLISGLEIYPNPVRHMAHLKRSDVDETLIINVVNTQGALLHQEKWNAHQPGHDISFEHLLPGMYVLLITNEAGTKARQYKLVRH
jgi:hypothetical protein